MTTPPSQSDATTATATGKRSADRSALARARAAAARCVHCGFCNATCPSYQVTSDERDGPRGRIELVQPLLAGQPVDAVVRRHLDRCLTCLACETTCPSGVRYGDIVHYARAQLERPSDARAAAGRLPPRPRRERWMRAWLRRLLPAAAHVEVPLRLALRLARALRPALPPALRGHIPPLRALPGRSVPAPSDAPDRSASTDASVLPDDVILLEGCVHRALDPRIDDALCRLLRALQPKIRIHRVSGCCGAIEAHLGDVEAGDRRLERLIARARALRDAKLCGASGDARPPIALVQTASGCSAHLARSLAHRDDVGAFVELRDPSEWLTPAHIEALGLDARGLRVAWQSPCSMTHGLRHAARVEALLDAAGFTRVTVAEPHLCCGSAGTYSILQPDIAQALRARKLAALTAEAPDAILTANIGCQTHLAGATDRPVVHYLVALASLLPDSPTRARRRAAR